MEKKIIQALIYEKSLPEIYRNVFPEMFEDEKLAFIFSCGKELYEAEKPCDLSAIFEHIALTYPEFYHTIPFDTFLNADVKNVWLLVEMFVENYVKKKVKELIENFDITGKTLYDVETFANQIKQIISRYSTTKIPSVDSFEKDLEYAFNEHDEKLIKTGWEQYDKMLNGGYRVGLNFIGATTKVGKSCFARHLAYRVVKNNENLKSAYFNFEMDKSEFLKKMVKVYQFENVCDLEKAKQNLLDDYKEKRMVVLNQHSRKIDNVVSTIEYLVSEFGVRFVVIDTFDKLLNKIEDSWLGVMKNVLILEECALRNNISILCLKQINVTGTKRVKGDDGKWCSIKINPKTERPDVMNSVGTKEPMRTASSFIVMYWDENDFSIVHFVEQCERYSVASTMDFRFNKETETYLEVYGSLFQDC